MPESPIDILYEDNHLLIINKKSGQIVQGDKTGDIPLSDLIKNYIKERDAKPGNVFLGVAHRLDRPVSGVLLFAKTSKALSRINKDFAEHNFRKIYWAICENKPPKDSDTLTDYICRDSKKNKSFICSKDHPEAKKATLRYKLISQSERYNLLEVELFSGRHHQIRLQLSSISCPIKGDLKYGSRRSNKDASISLHARYLEFTHPVRNEKIKIEAPCPSDKLWQILQGSIL